MAKNKFFVKNLQIKEKNKLKLIKMLRRSHNKFTSQNCVSEFYFIRYR